MSRAPGVRDRRNRAPDPADAAEIFVCAWCRGQIAQSSPERIKLTENFGICSECLEERLRVLDREPSGR